jgi:hypothetical protein
MRTRRWPPTPAVLRQRNHDTKAFRAMVRTVMAKRLDVIPDVIEAQWARGKSGPRGAADDRAEMPEQRRAMTNTRAKPCTTRDWLQQPTLRPPQRRVQCSASLRGELEQRRTAKARLCRGCTAR